MSLVILVFLLLRQMSSKLPRTPLGELTTLPQTHYSAGEGTPLPKNLPPRRFRHLVSSVYPPIFLAIHHWEQGRQLAVVNSYNSKHASPSCMVHRANDDNDGNGVEDVTNRS